MCQNLHCISDTGSEEQIFFLHDHLNRTLCSTHITILSAKSAGARITPTAKQHRLIITRPAVSHVACCTVAILSVKQGGQRRSLNATYYFPILLIVRNQFMLTDALYIHILWEIMSAEKCFGNWLVYSRTAGAQTVAYSLSALIHHAGLGESHCWLPLDKVRDLLPIWLPGFRLSAQGVTRRATKCHLSEDEFSQACRTPGNRLPISTHFLEKKNWPQWQAFLLHSSLTFLCLYF